MYEVFFFTNPIGINCFEMEQEILTAIDQSKENVLYHFIPMANINTIRSDLMARGLSPNNLKLLNHYSQSTFHAIRDYHAIKLLKGNKIARQFLFTLQNQINVKHIDFSQQIVEKIVNDLGINLKNFNQTRESAYTKLSIDKDQKLIEDYKVTTTPTTMIYNYDQDMAGVMIEGNITSDKIISALHPNDDSDSQTSELHLV
ncbi:dithiol-disulfide isomerase [Lactobacillus sp. PV037]|uniref:DsbA family protein n=1 Tax=unclassified Lactobacillus TaxID=2620435 RepID=UPI00223F6655|nr:MULTISPECIES: DsbA family protein [unclassified Lactobacillus]QNQ82587.1 dithiol-disulfide isomerase [Lactobacillus sp. PV012]QNQ83298.1 dithiol-disulfide isomerase [Lactobacillus sp. PV037]